MDQKSQKWTKKRMKKEKLLNKGLKKEKKYSKKEDVTQKINYSKKNPKK